MYIVKYISKEGEQLSYTFHDYNQAKQVYEEKVKAGFKDVILTEAD